MGGRNRQIIWKFNPKLASWQSYRPARPCLTTSKVVHWPHSVCPHLCLNSHTLSHTVCNVHAHPPLNSHPHLHLTHRQNDRASVRKDSHFNKSKRVSIKRHTIGDAFAVASNMLLGSKMHTGILWGDWRNKMEKATSWGIEKKPREKDSLSFSSLWGQLHYLSSVCSYGRGPPNPFQGFFSSQQFG